MKQKTKQGATKKNQLKFQIIPLRDWNIRYAYSEKIKEKIEISNNPFKGLKLSLCAECFNTKILKFQIIPLRDWNSLSIVAPELYEIEISNNPFKGLKLLQKTD